MNSVGGRSPARSVVVAGVDGYPIAEGGGGVAQLVRARGSYPRGRGFESLRRYQLPVFLPKYAQMAKTNR